RYRSEADICGCRAPTGSGGLDPDIGGPFCCDARSEHLRELLYVVRDPLSYSPSAGLGRTKGRTWITRFALRLIFTSSIRFPTKSFWPSSKQVGDISTTSSLKNCFRTTKIITAEWPQMMHWRSAPELGKARE